MLERRVEGEAREFAELRESLWRLCEIGRRKRMETKVVKPIVIGMDLWRKWKESSVRDGRSLTELLGEYINKELEKRRKK